MMSKICQSCSNVFYKKENESARYWEEKKCCCRDCANKFKKGKNFPNGGQFKNNIASWNKGIEWSEEHRKIISESCKGRPANSGSFKKGHSNVNANRIYKKGIENKCFTSVEKECEFCHDKFFAQKGVAEKARFCSSTCWHKWHRGKNSPVWTDNYKKTFKKRIMELPEYKNWRLSVFKRDLFTCQGCNQISGDIQAHHIKACYKILEDNNIKEIEEAINCKELWNIDNGLTLCRKCHRKTDSYGKQCKTK